MSLCTFVAGLRGGVSWARARGDSGDAHALAQVGHLGQDDQRQIQEFSLGDNLCLTFPSLPCPAHSMWIIMLALNVIERKIETFTC